MELLRQQLIAYRPWNEQEERDREELLRRLDSHEDLYTRANAAAHFTASAWVVSPDRSQVLMAYHKLYDSWAWLGGHAGGIKGHGGAVAAGRGPEKKTSSGGSPGRHRQPGDVYLSGI